MMDKRYKEYDSIIEKQKEELNRYKKRLADLVAAYKCLVKEKEVLESTLKAINQAHSPHQSSILSQDDTTSESEDSKDSPREDEVDQLKYQLTTLMNSLATLSEEKSRMEAGFQADKKQLRAEKQQLEGHLKEIQERLDNETKSHLSEMENFKSKLIIERHQREKEHNDHGVMIRELQKVVSEERGRREKANSEAEVALRRLSEAEERVETTERGRTEAKSRLDQLTEQLDNAKKGSGDLAIKLQAQLVAVKEQLSVATAKEQERASEAEERARSLAVLHEERVANLEARLAELSATVGNYDRLRQLDQQAIDKLKERLVQLELDHSEEKSDLSVDSLICRLKQVKELLEIANLSSEKPVEIKQIVAETFQLTYEKEVSHEMCKTAYNNLKQEFDFHKQKNSNLISNKMDSNNEIENSKNQIRNFKEKVRNLHEQLEQADFSHRKELQSQLQDFNKERCKYKEKIEIIEKEWKEEVEVLENQLVKQRERAIALVREKEQEIGELKHCFSHLIPHRPSLSDKEEGGVAGGMLHYSQELARRDVELSRLRKDKLNLEAEIRHISFLLEEAGKKEVDLKEALEHQLDRFSRYQSQDGANLEYLKNVVFNFLISEEQNCKIHMLNAIATILKFNDNERNKISHTWSLDKATARS